jgi:hypothetical protein
MKAAVLLASVVLSVGYLRQKDTPDPREAIVNALHPAPKPSKAPSAMTLLPGYNHASSVDFEGNTVGKISKAGGLSFEYEYPPFRHPRRDPNKSQYRQYVEETISGHRVWRGFRFERYEIDVDLCRSSEYSLVVQFRAEVIESSDATDMVTMALSLLRGDGARSDVCISMN